MDQATTQAIDGYVDRHRKEIIADLARLVEIPSVSKPGSPEPEPFGPDCAKVLAEALKMAEEKGMAAKNYGNWYGLATRGEGAHTVGIFSHLDVVEVGDDWTFPPFELTEKDGWLFGRGVADDKIAAVIGFHTAKALDELELAENIRLLLFLGVSEEKGMTDIDRYLEEHEPPEFSLVPDFMFPVSVGEQGVMKFKLSTDRLFSAIENFKGGEPGKRLPLTASADYTASGGARLCELARQNGLVTVISENGVVHINAAGRPASSYKAADSVNAIAAIASFLAGSGVLSGGDELVMNAVAQMAAGADGECFGIACADRLFGNLRCTCLLAEENDGKFVLHFDIRYPLGISGETIAAGVGAFAEKVGFTMTDVDDTPPWLFPESDPRVQRLCDCWNDVSGHDDRPRTGGGTYARKLKNAVSYGPNDFKKCPFLPKGHGEIHSPDETRSIETVLNAVKVYIRAFVALDEWYKAQRQ